MQAKRYSSSWGKVSEFFYFISNILKKVLVKAFGFFVVLRLKECGAPRLQMEEETEVLSCGFEVSPLL